MRSWAATTDLQPEAATTRTIGIVLSPRFLRGFNATIDWWDIKLKGAVARIGAQTIVDGCIANGDPIFCSRIHRDPNGSLWLGNGYVDDRQANLGGLGIRGIDAGADYSVPLGRLGSANFEFRGSYVLRWIVDNGGLSTPYDCAGLFGAPCEMHPRWRHTARATWTVPAGISLSLHWRRIGGAKLAALDPKFNLTNVVSPRNTQASAPGLFRRHHGASVSTTGSSFGWGSTMSSTDSRRSSSETLRPPTDWSTATPIPSGMMRSAASFSPAYPYPSSPSADFSAANNCGTAFARGLPDRCRSRGACPSRASI